MSLERLREYNSNAFGLTAKCVAFSFSICVEIVAAQSKQKPHQQLPLLLTPKSMQGSSVEGCSKETLEVSVVAIGSTKKLVFSGTGFHNACRLLLSAKVKISRRFQIRSKPLIV